MALSGSSTTLRARSNVERDRSLQSAGRRPTAEAGRNEGLRGFLGDAEVLAVATDGSIRGNPRDGRHIGTPGQNSSGRSYCSDGSLLGQEVLKSGQDLEGTAL